MNISIQQLSSLDHWHSFFKKASLTSLFQSHGHSWLDYAGINEKSAYGIAKFKKGLNGTVSNKTSILVGV